MNSFVTRAVAVSLCATLCTAASALADPVFRVEEQPGALVIHSGDQVVAKYVYRDTEVPRPSFSDVHTPAGIQVTRNYPPQEGDLQDHATYHPGIWLAFGDLSGADSWRGKAAVEHIEFLEKPAYARGILTFAVRNRYWNAAHDAAVCDEACQYYLTQGGRAGDAYLLIVESRFSSPQEFKFGDQEEMGLGVRLATPLIEKTGTGACITDSEFRTTARAVWGHAGDWCDYSGAINGKPVGVTLLSHRDNFRKPWWHARDYGLLVANPFGQQAFTKGEASSVVVAPGTEFHLRYGIVIHDGRPGAGYDPREAWKSYQQW
ncbi:MAG: PmoA family protein [Planctomycetaceae bacterium]|nr:PmoA family protein [Planctomycetaceae bacterium]